MFVIIMGFGSFSLRGVSIREVERGNERGVGGVGRGGEMIRMRMNKRS